MKKTYSSPKAVNVPFVASAMLASSPYTPITGGQGSEQDSNRRTTGFGQDDSDIWE